VALKDDPTRQDADRYPLRYTTRILYSDMDAFRHLNNGAAGRYFEEGRAELNIRLFGPDCMIAPAEGQQLLFASVTIDYIRQAHYPGELTIGTAIARVGGSSWVVVQAAFQAGQCFALADAVMVKASHGKGAPLTDIERGAMQQYLLRA
jgi:acyl-CoA thioester hydrolase